MRQRICAACSTLLLLAASGCVHVLAIYFQRRGAKVLPPRGTFVPWNAQAVFVSAPAFFGLLLPILPMSAPPSRPPPRPPR